MDDNEILFPLTERKSEAPKKEWNEITAKRVVMMECVVLIH